MNSNTINNFRSNSPSPVASFTNTSASATSSPGTSPARASRFVEQMDDFELSSAAGSVRSTSPQPAAPGLKAYRFFNANVPSAKTVVGALQSALKYIGLGVAVLLALPFVITGAVSAGIVYGGLKIAEMVQQRYAQPNVSTDGAPVKQD